jgi:hypothetical protein
MSNSFPLNSLFMYLEKNAIIPGVLAIRSFILSGKLTKFSPSSSSGNQLYPGSKQNDRLVFAAKLTQFVIFLIKTSSLICEGSNLLTGFDPFTANKTLYQWVF